MRIYIININILCAEAKKKSVIDILVITFGIGVRACVCVLSSHSRSIARIIPIIHVNPFLH